MKRKVLCFKQPACHIAECITQRFSILEIPRDYIKLLRDMKESIFNVTKATLDIHGELYLF